MRKIALLLLGFLFSGLVSAQDASVDAPNGGPTAPLSGCALSSTEIVKVRIFNFGPGTINTNFNISYTINAGAPVTETVIAPNIPANSSVIYTFTTPADLSAPGTYTFDFNISGVAGDGNVSNDSYIGYSVTNTAASVGGTVSGGTNVCISSNSGSVTLAGQTGSVVNWESSTDNGSTWVNIGNTSTTQNYSNLTVKTLYRAVVQNGTCAVARSVEDTVYIDPATVAGSVSGSATKCTGANSGTLTSTGRTGNILKWQFSINGGTTYTDIANTASTQTYTNLTTTTKYRVEVQSGSCPSSFSTAATITISPNSVGGTVSGSASVCSGSNSGTLTLSGNTGTIQRWEMSTDGGVTWTNITNTTTTQTYTNLTQTTKYRVLVKSGACSAIYSGIATITVSSGTVAGSLLSSTSVCSGSNAGVLTLTGYTGTVQNWEYSTDGGTTFTVIASTFDTLNYLNLTTSTIYRVKVQNGGCTPAYSTSATITVDPITDGGTTSPAMTVCSGSNAGTVTLSGNTGSVTSWESSIDGITWTSIANTTTSQSFTNLVDTTFYRAIVKSGVCAADTSTLDTILVDAPTVAGVVDTSKNVCFGNNFGTLDLSGHTGSVVRWEYSIDGGINWLVINNTTTSFTYSNITVTTKYRAVVKNGTCNTQNSAAATLTVDPVSEGGTINSSTTTCGGSNGTLTLINYIGNIVQWESSTDGGATWTTIANTTAQLVYSNIVTTTMYHAIVQSGVCSYDTSAVATITVDEPTIGGILSSSATVCASGNSGTLTLSGNNGNVLSWQQSTDGGNTWITIANTDTAQVYNNLTITTKYRVYVQNGVCPADTSSSAIITVDPVVQPGSISGTGNVCESANAGVLMLTGYVGTITDWETSVDGILFSSAANNSDTLSYNNLVDTTWYRIILSSGSCPNDTAYGVINVSPATNAGFIATSDTVCAGNNGGTLSISGATGNVTNWEFSNDGGFTWIPVANTSVTQAYNNLSVTTIYRAYVKSGVCATDTSIAATITVDPVVEAGTISGGNVAVCASSNSGTLTLNGTTGNVSEWQSSVDGGATWTSIVNTTSSQSYNNLTDTTWYRAVVNSGTCGNDTTSATAIFVSPETIAGTITGTDTVCTDTNNGVLRITGYVGSVTNWEISTDGGNIWIAISNTSDSIVYNNLTVSTWYRAYVKSGVCSMDTTSLAWIKVDPQAIAGTIQGGNISTCASGNGGALVLNGYSGSIAEWQSSMDGGATWTSISNTTATQNYNNLADTTWYRAIVTSGTCGTDTSAVTVINVAPATVGGVMAGADTVCAGSNNGVLKITGYVGAVLNWEISTDGNTWMAISNNSDSLVYNNLNTTTWYRAYVKSGVCNMDTTTTAQIMVTPVSIAGAITGAMAGCEGLVSGTLTSSGNIGDIQKWQSSSDGMTWSDIANTASTQSYNNLTDTLWYRTIVKSGTCSADTATSVSVIVYPKPVASFITDTVCFGNPVQFANNSSVASGFIEFNQWNFADNDGSVATSPVHTYAIADTFDVKLYITSDQGCRDTANAIVIVHPLPDASISANGSLEFCSGIGLTLTAASGPYTYSWSTGANSQSIVSASSGTISITVTDTVTGCMNMDSLKLKAFTQPKINAGSDTSVSLGYGIQLNVSAAGSNIVSYSWSPSSSLDNALIQNPVASPIETTVYIVTGTDANGCTDQDSIEIKVITDFKITISNVMTPNGDGFNDTWIIDNIQNYPNTSVIIVNRNGQELFQSSAYDNSWAGTYNGKQLPDGTYYYVVKLSGSDKILKGGITIVNAK